MTRLLVEQLVRAVQDAMVAESTRRAGRGEPGVVTAAQQQALALSVLRREFRRIDERRVADGAARLSEADEDDLTERVLAEAVGLGPVDLLMADESLEELVAPRFDVVFEVRSDGSVTEVTERLWRDERALNDWVAHLARTAGRTERQFNAQNPTLVMRVGEGMRLAATRDVSQHFLEPDQIMTLAAEVTAPPARYRREERRRDGYPEYGLLVRFAAFTGLRAGELVALRAQDLDLMRSSRRSERLGLRGLRRTAARGDQDVRTPDGADPELARRRTR